MKIAIVEDDKFTQRMLMGYINRYYEMDQRRYSIDVFADGDEILEDFKACYDLILLDIEMKRTDGVKALDFVLKPVNYYMLEQMLQKVERLLIKKIGTTVLNGGVSMVIFFVVNKMIFPEKEKNPQAI